MLELFNQHVKLYSKPFDELILLFDIFGMIWPLLQGNEVGKTLQLKRRLSTGGDCAAPFADSRAQGEEVRNTSGLLRDDPR